MSNLPADFNKFELALIGNDLSKLSSAERLNFYRQVCESVGLNPLTRPMEFITLNGKLTLYATKGATDQLRKINGISFDKTESKIVDNMLETTVYGHDKTGRTDLDMAAIDITGLRGVDLANAKMKCISKAKRRFTLSMSGLGVLDETEVEDVKEAQHIPFPIGNPFNKAFEETKAELMPPEPPFDDQIPEDVKPPSDDEYFGNYIIPIGKDYKGKAIKDVDQFKLDGFLKWLKNDAKSKGKELTGPAVEFVQKAEAFLSSREVKSESK